jgi:hypothetical protein
MSVSEGGLAHLLHGPCWRSSYWSPDVPGTIRRLACMNGQLLAPLGLGADISGVYLLTTALLGKPTDLFSITRAKWGFNAEALLDRLDSRARAWIALPALMGGFALQVAGGHLASGAGAEPASWRSTLLSVIVGLLPPMAAWALLRRPLISVALRRLVHDDLANVHVVATCCRTMWPREAGEVDLSAKLRPEGYSVGRAVVQRVLRVELPETLPEEP